MAAADGRHLAIELRGLWDGAAIGRYLAELRSSTLRIVRHGRYKGAIVDASAYPIQPGPVAQGHAQAMRLARSVYGVRAAIMLPARGSKLQIVRLAEETGHRAFATREDAQDWLLS